MSEIKTHISSMSPIPRRQISGEVARQIQQMIAGRSLREGDRLPTEREIAGALEVSRGAVREGLKFLAALDIVDIRQGAGIFVKRVQQLVLLDASTLGSDERRQMLADSTEARRAIDCAAIEAATPRITDQQIAELRDYLTEADTDPTRTRLGHSIDLNFEAMIGRMSGNPYIVALQVEAHRYFRAAWEAAGLIPRPSQERSDQHWAIFTAIAARDRVEALRLMQRHFKLQALSKN